MLDDSVNRCAPLHWLCFKVCHKFEGKINKIVFRFFFFFHFQQFWTSSIVKKIERIKKTIFRFYNFIQHNPLSSEEH